ncbi:hypothetical protein [Thiospirillum jenense]|uniref:Site-specific DNA-methyltransferase (adenine-specific) n=1 Tax=Thiospirillum jenense TaxID=1653858 RepID=A0A839H501_9GAMM|nr:hypothetical protein [Thiospirillum jenense]MBB1125115.1 hypothetical protein [Thiospirillum jenense]
MTTPHRHREETLNTQLALLLTEHGIDAESEVILASGQHRPDVLFLFDGLRVMLEGKFDDVTDAATIVLRDAQRRMDSGMCHIAIALVYPHALRTTATAKMATKLAITPLSARILSEAGATDWASVTVTELLTALRRVRETLLQDDIVAQAAQRLSERIETIAALWAGQAATCDKLSNLLGIPINPHEPAEECAARRATATKVAALVLANALIFQEQLASSRGDGRFDSLRAYDQATDPIDAIKTNWHWIWNNVNYVPIFQLGETILAELPINLPAISAVRWLINEAKQLCANQAALRHDLMGRIYHWLLHHAKYLGTYYTSTAAATLLLKLTFMQTWREYDKSIADPNDWPLIDFTNLRRLTEFKVADLSCGTGTLLMAAGQAIADRFVLERVTTGRGLNERDLDFLYESVMENVLYGYDVLPSAVHLTATTLGMLSLHVSYRRMNLFILPMGVQGDDLCRLGSLDFIGADRIPTQLTLDTTQFEQLDTKQTDVRAERIMEAVLPPLDLCVMNPPFVRSVGGNLLFGSLPDKERELLQKELKRQVKNLPASITAGLGSVFLAMVSPRIRIGGRMALILPVALATGEAWGASRALLAREYTVEIVVVSHDPDHANFSENTDLSELLFIARKRAPHEPAGMTCYVNLWHNPRTVYDALDLFGRIERCQPAVLDGQSVTSLHTLMGRPLAEVMQLPASENDDQWLGVQFAQVWTLRTAAQLQLGQLVVPGQQPMKLPLCALKTLGELGPDQRRIHDGFKMSETDWSPYSAFWNHNAKQVVTIAQQPNSHLLVWEQSPRGADYGPRLLWPRAGRILLVERIRANTQRVIAIGFDEPMLGNTWWALQTNLTNKQERALLIWLNSTPALLLLLSRRVTTQTAWMKFKQPAWAAMPVLDVRNLPDTTIDALADAYTVLCQQPLLALAKLNEDPTRAAIDAALTSALNLPDLRPLRQLLAREPGLTGVGLSPKPAK